MLGYNVWEPAEASIEKRLRILEEAEEERKRARSVGALHDGTVSPTNSQGPRYC